MPLFVAGGLGLANGLGVFFYATNSTIDKNFTPEGHEMKEGDKEVGFGAAEESDDGDVEVF